MRRGTIVAVAVAAAVVFLLGVFLLGVGSGYALGEIGPWTSGVPASAADGQQQLAQPVHGFLGRRVLLSRPKQARGVGRG